MTLALSPQRSPTSRSTVESNCPAFTTVAELEIPVSYPSQNQLGGNARGGAGWHYRRLRQEFASALFSALSAFNVPKATTKRRVWLSRLFKPGKRAYDVANLIGGGKHIVDCLVARALLIDDSPKWFEGIYAQTASTHDAIRLRFDDI
jgi:hypothetical protein